MTDAQLSKITAITEPKQKVDQYKTLITELVGASDVAGLKSVVSHRMSLRRGGCVFVLEEGTGGERASERPGVVRGG